MTRFLDGPAAGVALTLRRAPLYLRAARDQHGKWDALDLLDDEPAEGEDLVAYRRVGPAGVMHLDYTDRVTRRRRGAWFKTAEYAVCAVQPHAETMRSAELWRAWCVAEAELQPEGGRAKE